jgi:hypothetical protein
MHSSDCLYRHLLGSSWDQLADVVRRLHQCSDVIHAQGSGRVLRGHSLLSRFLAHALHMPKGTDRSTVTLTVTRMRHAELWKRSFDGRRLVTTQTGGPERSLVESWGPLEFHFRLEPREGALYYHQQACGLRMGRIRISLAAWASPQVSAREGPTTSANQCTVSVAVVAPLAGTLLGYDAEVEILSQIAL